MRALGTILMGFGLFFVAVAAIAVLGPALRAAGVDVHAATTSTIGTALIGVLALAAGALLRRLAVARAMRRRGAFGTPDAGPRDPAPRR